MYCPKCKREYESGSKYCSFCEDLSGQPIRLVEDLQQSSGLSLNLGDDNAIMGGLHMTDSHNVHNEDKSVHNISNVTNVTQVTAQKTELEILQDKKTLYLNECKRACEDNLLDPAEEVALEECRIKLGLDKSTANTILESVRVMSDRNARKSELNPIAKTKLKRLSSNLQKNEVKALMDQIDSLEPLVRRFDHDELSRKYYLVLAALKPEKCIEQKERTKTDTYWEAFWCYLAYIKAGRLIDAEETLASLDHFSSYPEDNMTVLAAAGALMMGHTDEAKEYLDAVTGEYTPALQRFVDSLYLLLDPDMAKEMGADENTCAFYLVNFFGQKDPKVKAEEERKRKEAEEAERRKQIEEEKKRKAEEEKKRRAEEKAKREAEEQARREAEEKKKAAEEARLKSEAKRKRREEAVAKSISGKYSVQPQTSKELRSIIVGRLRKDRNADLNDIDICRIKDMRGLFRRLKIGNIDISQWDVSKVEMMYEMFMGCENFNCDLSSWDVRNVKSMSYMFEGCKKFEGKGLEKWDVSNVQYMAGMFWRCENFNCDLSKWDVSNVEDMSFIFLGCKSLKNIPDWYKNK